MINSFAILSLIASVALAQQAPSGLSSTCQKFYESLNANSELSACTASVAKATPGASSSSGVSAALTSLCADTAKCPEAAVRAVVANFGKDCSAELTSNEEVKKLYQSIYVLVPLREAICAKNEDGGWCLSSVSSKVDAETKSNAQKYMAVKDGSATNFTTFGASNSAFLFTNGDWSQSALCTRCTNQILSSYINWQSTALPALSDIQLINGLTKLYESVTKTCGPEFMSGAVQAAGGISTGFGGGSNGAPALLADAKSLVFGVLGAASFALVL